MSRRWPLRIAIAIAVLFVLLVVVDVAVDRPLRAYLERQANARLTGYRVTLGACDLRLFNGSLVLKNAIVRQDAHPDPPVASFPHFEFNVQWTALLRGRLVADVDVRHPALHLVSAQLAQERRDDVAVADRGWQDAIGALYPLKINEWSVTGGTVTYVGDDPKRPLTITDLAVLARDIRNVQSRPGDYPSPVAGSFVLFDDGRVRFDGHADFLAEPRSTIKVNVALEDVPLERLAPLADDVHLKLSGGRLAAVGTLEYGREITMAAFDELTLSGLRLDYVSLPATKAEAKEQRQEAGEAAKEASNKPGLLLRANRFRIVDSEFGFLSRVADPAYRVFVTGTELTIENFSNQFREGPAKFRLEGLFMGSGRAVAAGVFRPDKKGPDFELELKLEGTDMRTMNDVFRAHAGLDVAKGTFSLYSELRANNGLVDGYVKPLFKDLDILEKRQDRDKSLVKKVYEGIVEGLSKLFENDEREEVATVTRVRGQIGNTSTSNWQAVVGLIQNAFFQAILPGFEREAGGRRPPGRRADRGKASRRD